MVVEGQEPVHLADDQVQAGGELGEGGAVNSFRQSLDWGNGEKLENQLESRNGRREICRFELNEAALGERDEPQRQPALRASERKYGDEGALNHVGANVQSKV